MANILHSCQGLQAAKTAVYLVGGSPYLKWHPVHTHKEHAPQVTALHLACLCCAPSYIIELLLDACGTSACSKVAQPSGEAPLHLTFLLAMKSPVHHQGH
jgi:hypothetical protein